MGRANRHTLIALFLGGGIGAGLYWLSGYASLALVAGLCWACGLELTFRIGRLYPAYATGETWADKRWTGLSVALVTLAALTGVSPALPIAEELRLGLGVLVTGAGVVAYAAGTIAVLERVEDASAVAPSSAGTSYSADGD